MITASIVTYSKSSELDLNSYNQIILKKCILSLCNTNLVSNILIVDNSPKALFSWCLELNNKVMYYHTKGSNLGYGKAHNLSKKLIKLSKYHIIVNPDIVFTDSNCINKLFTIMEENKNIGLVQPLIKSYPDGNIQKLCKRNPTFLIQFIRLFPALINKLKWIKSYNEWYEMDNIAYKKKEVDSQYLSGCFMFCRVLALNKVSWFDEDFFMYMEDADLTRRLSRISRCVHIPYIEILHVWARGNHKKFSLRIIAIISFFIYSWKWGLKLF